MPKYFITVSCWQVFWAFEISHTGELNWEIVSWISNKFFEFWCVQISFDRVSKMITVIVFSPYIYLSILWYFSREVYFFKMHFLHFQSLFAFLNHSSAFKQSHFIFFYKHIFENRTVLTWKAWFLQNCVLRAPPFTFLFHLSVLFFAYFLLFPPFFLFLFPCFFFLPCFSFFLLFSSLFFFLLSFFFIFFLLFSPYCSFLFFFFFFCLLIFFHTAHSFLFCTMDWIPFLFIRSDSLCSSTYMYWFYSSLYIPTLKLVFEQHQWKGLSYIRGLVVCCYSFYGPLCPGVVNKSATFRSPTIVSC
jgi:hypothetical protein